MTCSMLFVTANKLLYSGYLLQLLHNIFYIHFLYQACLTVTRDEFKRLGARKGRLSNGYAGRKSVVSVALYFAIVYDKVRTKTLSDPLFQLCLNCDDLGHLCTI